jgi:hypothetical protein
LWRGRIFGLRCALDLCHHLFVLDHFDFKALFHPRCRRFREKPSGTRRRRSMIFRGSWLHGLYSELWDRTGRRSPLTCRKEFSPPLQ